MEYGTNCDHNKDYFEERLKEDIITYWEITWQKNGRKMELKYSKALMLKGR